MALVESRGRTVGKDELMNMVWPDTYVEEGNLTQNISVLRKALAGGADPTRYRAHDNLGRAYEQKGMLAQALAEFERAVATSQEGSATLASQGAGFAAAGRRDEALRILNRLKLASRSEYVPAYGLAEIYAALGDKDQAFAWLEKAYEERSSAASGCEGRTKKWKSKRNST